MLKVSYESSAQVEDSWEVLSTTRFSVEKKKKKNNKN